MPDEAGTIETAHGKVEFVCLVGLTDKELQSIVNEEYTTVDILNKLPTSVTDYERDAVI